MRRHALLLQGMALLVAGCGVSAYVPPGCGQCPMVCRTAVGAEAAVLIWTETVDIDSFSAGFAPPALEIMADGRVIADGTRIGQLTPAQARSLTQQVARDLEVAGVTATSLSLPRQDWRQEGGGETITVWPDGFTPVTAQIDYVPVPSAPRPPKPAHAWDNLQPLDAGMPPLLRDTVDQLIGLRTQALAHGAPYESDKIDVFVSGDPYLLALLSHGRTALSTTLAKWPSGLAPASQDIRQLEHGYLPLIFTDAPAAAARTAFAEYGQWPSTTQLYDASPTKVPLRRYGVWRPMVPTELDRSLIPTPCPTAPSTPVPT